MKLLVTGLLGISALTGFARELDAAAGAKLVAWVDALKVPVDPKLLGGPQPIGDGGDDEPAIKIDKAFLASDKAFAEGVEASLMGPREKPVAVIFYVQSAIGYHYVPFKGVKEIDRPRRLSKVADRLYRIESNRFTRGVKVEKLLP
ncbi:hypothetical protein [Luteolibacter arcticus]|nr:hypothetical protein [Luteolibacter arcticus]